MQSDLILTRIETAAAMGSVLQQQNLSAAFQKAQAEQKEILREILESHDIDPDAVQIVNVDSDTRVAKLAPIPMEGGPKVLEMPKADALGFTPGRDLPEGAIPKPNVPADTFPEGTPEKTA